ncbi:MAG: ribonuclease T2 [Ancalomicrobiaceae bacterium]|nr:ribonuclease T2 [Ancalomicrobiaceae bacterium]
MRLMPLAAALVVAVLAGSAASLAQSAPPQPAQSQTAPTKPTQPAAATPSDFDFYVVALSWSPSFCEAKGDQQKAAECARPFGFMLHGLWPQSDKSFIPACSGPADRLPDALIKAQLDIYPAYGLVIHEWRAHGACSGLDASAYFKAARTAFAKVKLPDTFKSVAKPTTVEVAQVRQDFIAANPGLEASDFTVTCNAQRLSEVRVCVSKDLSGFRPCPKVARSTCGEAKVYVPAIRGAR